VYQKGKSLNYDLNSILPLSQVFEYRKSKNIGFDLSSTIPMSMQFTYGIGDSLFYELNSAISLSNTFEYRRSKDIGADLSSQITLTNDFAYYRSYDLMFSLSSSLSLSNNFVYRRSKDIGVSLNSLLTPSMSFIYTRSMFAYNLNSTITMSMSIAYTKAYDKATSPTISNKTVTDVKAWTNSTEIYWNAQDPSNRDTWVGTSLPTASGYPVGFAMRLTDGTFPVTYTYHKVIKTGDVVSWKITNNDEATCTVYCKVGTSSYLNYGTLASGATTDRLTRTVTNGLTTVYAYITVTNKSNSDEVSL
jgi:hypothetical protein